MAILEQMADMQGKLIVEIEQLKSRLAALEVAVVGAELAPTNSVMVPCQMHHDGYCQVGVRDQCQCNPCMLPQF